MYLQILHTYGTGAAECAGIKYQHTTMTLITWSTRRAGNLQLCKSCRFPKKLAHKQ